MHGTAPRDYVICADYSSAEHIGGASEEPVPSPLVTAPAALQSSPLTLTQVLGRREAAPTVRSSIPPARIPLPPRSYLLRPALLTPHLQPD